MFPLSFKEFMMAADKPTYDYMQGMKGVERLPEIIYNKLRSEYRRYLICGGMPRSVVAMIEDKDIAKVDSVLTDIIHCYTLDFSKHAPKADIPRIREIWDSIPSQLAKENRKFIYKLVRPGARAREYERALLWLQLAGLIYKVNCNSAPAMPLTAYDDISAFKIYLFDIGVFRVLSRLPASVLLEDNSLLREFKGAYFENAVLQAFVPQFNTMPRYWVSSGKAEVDFLLQGDHSIIPVEVKADLNTSGKSLNVYITKYNPDYSVIVSGQNASEEGRMVRLPHSCSAWLTDLLQF